MYTIPDNYNEELSTYRKWVENVLNDEAGDIQFKVYRVGHGIYEQRRKGAYMARIRCAGGMIKPGQLLRVSELTELHGSSFLHITTRQEIQMHNLPLAATPDILDELYQAGLSTKGGGGNTVRNITASVESGIDEHEAFDVTPYCTALTSFLIARNDSFDLPRKLKIALSCSADDSALAAFNDLGFIAAVRDDVRGFKVFMGGSPSVKPMVGHVIFDFIPAGKIFNVALAVIDFFNRYGNRKNRHKARLRYVFYKYGPEKTIELFQEVYNQYKQHNYETVKQWPNPHGRKQQAQEAVSPSGTDYEHWRKSYTQPQKQEGLYTIVIPVMHGNMTTVQAKSIAQLAAQFGNDTIRFSRRQNIHLRHIPASHLGNVYQLLQDIEIDTSQPPLLGNMVSCTGADTCQLGICFSKGGMQAVHDQLSNNPLLEELNELDINISGCPNACGQHLVADLGLAGRVSRNGRIYPSYNVFAGAIIHSEHAALPLQLGEVAARDIPAFTDDLLTLYATASNGRSMRTFITEQQEDVQALFTKYKKIPTYEEDKRYYIDWGHNELFTLEARGGGECSAGRLDMIEAEMKIIRKCSESLHGQQEIEEQTMLLHELILSSSKLLCLIHQKQPATEQEILDEVKDHFLDRLNFPEAYAMLGDFVLTGNFVALLKQKELALEYANDVVKYYRNLDENLQPTNTFMEITPTTLKVMLDQGSDVQLVDVREPWEKEMADIGGLLIPLGQIAKQADLIPTAPKIVLYCRTGRRSAEAINLLMESHGFENLYNLKGGIYAWANEVDPTMQKY